MKAQAQFWFQEKKNYGFLVCLAALNKASFCWNKQLARERSWLLKDSYYVCFVISLLWVLNYATLRLTWFGSVDTYCNLKVDNLQDALEIDVTNMAYCMNTEQIQLRLYKVPIVRTNIFRYLLWYEYFL